MTEPVSHAPLDEVKARVRAALDILESASSTGGRGPMFSYRGTALTYEDIRALSAPSETRPSNDRYLAAAAECRLRAKLDPGARCGDVLLPAAELLEAAAQGGLSVAQTELEAIHALAMNPQDTAPKEGDPYTLSLLKQLLAIRLAPSAIGDTDYKALYMELLYAVANKWPEESRHQTALRYIRERENMPSDPKCASTDGNNTERQT